MVEHTEDNTADGFSTEWLTLREPADHAARSMSLTQQLGLWAAKQASLQVLEMGCGTGSNLRYLSPHLGHDQRWTLLDNDESLLQNLPAILQQWAVLNNIEFSVSADAISLSNSDFSATVQWQQADLANELEALAFDRAHLVTASALLDLTSQAWLQRLAKCCIDNECASLFALNYDGRINWQPSMQFDATVSDLLNQHQMNDKGFGPAMGPQAGNTMAQHLSASQHVTIEPSDWHITPNQQALQTALIDGWLDAAAELAAGDLDELRQWHETRRAAIASTESSLKVGHIDILSLPLSDDSTVS